MSDELKVYYDGGDSSFAARDLDDAVALWEEYNGCKWADEHQDDKPVDIWSERPLDKEVTVTFDYASDGRVAAPAGAEIVPHGDYGCKVKATWRAWAAKTGRGVICSENW